MIIDLNGNWKVKRADESEFTDAIVPGSLYMDYIRTGKLEDPFFRAENEKIALELCEYDYTYEKRFEIESTDIIGAETVVLHFDGIDTLADIYLNDTLLDTVKNMHRIYEYDVRYLLHSGINILRLDFKSPNKYIEKKQKEYKLNGVDTTLEGYPHLRKAHCMFGWDWGPQLPDLGIWRRVYLETRNIACIDNVYVTQNHIPGAVELELDIEINPIAADREKLAGLMLTTEIYDPAGRKTEICEELKNIIYNSSDSGRFGDYTGRLYDENNMISGMEANKKLICLRRQVTVNEPELWWPNGFGSQPLYNIKVILSEGDTVLSVKSHNIGLRTIEIDQSPSEWGERFAVNVNGKEIFIMGGNYIPENSILNSVTEEKTEQLIKSCADINYNCLRVWGGGIYPSDHFYDLCDKYGLLVWQDFLFACAVYRADDEFTNEIIHEAEDNIKRLRNHPSLFLWCGNNEVEQGMESGWCKTDNRFELNADYLKLFEMLLPNLIKTYDPNRFYWPSSPSSGGSFDQPNAFERGDCHYWGVWHGREPLEKFREYYFGFASEYGMQAFPSLKTIESFTLPEDRNIFSYVMERHQRSYEGNEKIMSYISQYYKFPKDFSSLIYLSQLLQGDGIRNAVEHWRRNRGRCMGSLYWQVNDCYPVASWASIDSKLRWKALHYFAKRFYAPVMISVNDKDICADVYIANEMPADFSGMVTWRLCDNSGKIIREQMIAARVMERSSAEIVSLDFSDDLKSYGDRPSVFMEYSVTDGKQLVSRGSVPMTKCKYFNFISPKISAEVEDAGDKFCIKLSSDVYAKYVELDIAGGDCLFSDNYFDLFGRNELYEICVEKSSLLMSNGGTPITNADDFKKVLTIRSLADTY